MPRKTEHEPSEAGHARGRENTPSSADRCEAEGGAARGILEPDRLRENLETLKMKNILDDFDFSFQPSIDKRQIDELATMRFLENGENVVFLGPLGVGKTHLASALGLVAAQHRFSTYYINCHQLIEQLKKAHFENRLPDKLKVLAKYRMLIIDEIGYLPMDIQGANLFFQLIARQYEKTSTVFTSNKTFSQWNEVFADVTIASAILDRVLHHHTVINVLPPEGASWQAVALGTVIGDDDRAFGHAAVELVALDLLHDLVHV